MKIFGIFAYEIQKNKINKANIGAFISFLYIKLLVTSTYNFGPIFFKNILLFYNPNKALNKYFLNKYINATLNTIGFFK